MPFSEEQLARLTLAQEQDHALILLDAEARIVGWHMAAQALFGYSAQEVLGMTIHPLFVPEDRERGEPEHEVEIATRRGKAEDDRWSLRKDGSRFWASGLMTCLRDENGAVAGYSKIVRDRTDIRSQLETHLNRVAALERANEARNLLLATLAHELRNPLGVMKNASHLLQLVATEYSGVTAPVKTIERQIGFIQRLVDDLFETARLEQGKVQLELSSQPLRSIVDRAVETCSELIAASHQQLEILFPPGEIVLDADPIRLQQALVNLIANASKFSQSKGKIWIKATVEGNEAVLRVEDHGKGIPHALLPTIFDIFTQAAPFDNSVPAGLGLGLSLVKSIVELHGGSVQARSEGEGKGSEFIVHLPLWQRRTTQSSAGAIRSTQDHSPPSN